jgi:long-subunit acyl-CoA synthetase (AMP-forming)
VQALLEHEALSRLGDLSEVDMPKKIGLLPNPFSIEDGTLTLTDKVKRRVVQERYASLIDRFYAPEGEDRTVFTV